MLRALTEPLLLPGARPLPSFLIDLVAEQKHKITVDIRRNIYVKVKQKAEGTKRQDRNRIKRRWKIQKGFVHFTLQKRNYKRGTKVLIAREINTEKVERDSGQDGRVRHPLPHPSRQKATTKRETKIHKFCVMFSSCAAKVRRRCTPLQLESSWFEKKKGKGNSGMRVGFTARNMEKYRRKKKGISSRVGGVKGKPLCSLLLGKRRFSPPPITAEKRTETYAREAQRTSAAVEIVECHT